MLNSAIIMGRLTRDPDVRQTQSGISVCSFSVAVDRDVVDKSTGERGTDFINVTAWRSTADFVGKYFSKGSLIVVDGRLQVSGYTDKDGNKRTSTEIVANNVYFGGSKKKEDSNNASSSHVSNDVPPAQSSDTPGSDDDLPF